MHPPIFSYLLFRLTIIPVLRRIGSCLLMTLLVLGSAWANGDDPDTDGDGIPDSFDPLPYDATNTGAEQIGWQLVARGTKPWFVNVQAHIDIGTKVVRTKRHTQQVSGLSGKRKLVRFDVGETILEKPTYTVRDTLRFSRPNIDWQGSVLKFAANYGDYVWYHFFFQDKVGRATWDILYKVAQSYTQVYSPQLSFSPQKIRAEFPNIPVFGGELYSISPTAPSHLILQTEDGSGRDLYLDWSFSGLKGRSFDAVVDLDPRTDTSPLPWVRAERGVSLGVPGKKVLIRYIDSTLIAPNEDTGYELVVTHSTVDPDLVNLWIEDGALYAEVSNPKPDALLKDIDLTYGEVLASSDLLVDGTTSGTLSAVSLPLGIILSAGQHPFSATFTPDDPAYQTVTLTANVNVAKAQLYVTHEPVQFPYGGPPFAPSKLRYTGFVNGDDVSNIGNPIFSKWYRPINGSLPDLTSLTVGNHPSMGFWPQFSGLSGVDEGNYVMNTRAGDIIVTPAQLIISASTVSRTYGGPSISSNSLSIAGWVGDDAVAGYEAMFAVSDPGPETPVGSYTLTPVAQASAKDQLPNYEFVFQTGTLTIIPAPLVARADNLHKTIGTRNPKKNIIYSGFVNGENPGDLRGRGSLVHAVKTGTATGVYPITWKWPPRGKNYTVTTLDGEFFVHEIGNDTIVSPMRIEGDTGQLDGDNRFASEEPGEPDHAGNVAGSSLWYAYEPEFPGILELKAGRLGDPLLGVYEIIPPNGLGTSWGRLTMKDAIAGLRLFDDPFAEGLQLVAAAANSRMSVLVQPTKRYLILVDTRFGDGGRFRLKWTLRSANDRFSQMPELGGSYSGTNLAWNTNASREHRERVPRGPKVAMRSLWYRYTPDADGHLAVDTQRSYLDASSLDNTQLDTVVHVYTGDEIRSLALVSLSDDAPPNEVFSETTVKAIAHEPLIIRVDVREDATVQEGIYQLNWLFTPLVGPSG